MRALTRKTNRMRRRGAVIVEFALTVPFLFIVIFGVIDFSRAYSQLNAINSGLREGARAASVMTEAQLTDFATAQSTVRQKVRATAAVFGYNSVDVSKVTLTLDNPIEFVTVNITAHPVPLPVLGKFLGISPFTVTRSLRYRWERTGQ
jgi:Flp pilus assembly protein TadG